VQDDADVEFGALRPVGGIHFDHSGDGGFGLCEGLADSVSLASVRDPDSDVLWA
jgi:hypothetical protein